jgi:hypothetical protein
MMLTIGNDIGQWQEISFVVVLSLHGPATNVLFASFNSSFQASTQHPEPAVSDLLRDIYRSLEI